MQRRVLAVLAVLPVLLPGTAPALAQKAPSGAGVAVRDAWARPTIGASHEGVVYLTVTDHGAADRLLGASTPVAGQATLHETRAQGGVMRMRDVAALPVPAGGTLVLRPGGDHVMLTDMRRHLAAGDTFPLTLRFAKAGAVTTTVTVRPLGAGGAMPGMEMGHGGGMQGMTGAAGHAAH